MTLNTSLLLKEFRVGTVATTLIDQEKIMRLKLQVVHRF